MSASLMGGPATLGYELTSQQDDLLHPKNERSHHQGYGKLFGGLAFDTEDSAFRLATPGTLSMRSTSRHKVLLWIFAITNLVALVVSVVAVVTALRVSKPAQQQSPNTTASSAQTTSRIAFGSCSAYDLRPQNIWIEGVIPSSPDAWIWLGDMAYLDDPVVSCEVQPSLCNCTLDFIRSNPMMCSAGNFQHGRERMSRQVSSIEYRQFLEYMCPGAAAAGQFPPQGSDPGVCPKPIFGVYDDHDYGWNNGNKRLPDKDRYKNLYLDAIGEPMTSIRRNINRGLYTSNILNQGQAGREVQVVLLDERYERDTLPCEMRRAWCSEVLMMRPQDPWCRDFLLDDGSTGQGSCCFKDEQAVAWCNQKASQKDPMYAAVCDPTSSAYGSKRIALMTDTDVSTETGPGKPGALTWELLDGSLSNWQDSSTEADTWRWLVQDSSFCDILGTTQRDWLRSTLGLVPNPSNPSPPPALRIVASSSVPFGSMGYSQMTTGGHGLACSGDDWACYKPAQVHLLHTLANATRDIGGCTIVLTGDYHHADIKVVMPGAGHAYSSWLRTDHLAAPVYQAMASGMSDSTATGDTTCVGTYKEDLMGLRPAGPCAFTPYANFGMLSVDWDQQLVHLQVRDKQGQIAKSVAGTDLQVTFSLKTCLPV